MTQRKHSRHDSEGNDGEISHVQKIHAMNGRERKKLEVVVKCDAVGSEEAVVSLLTRIKTPGVEMRVIHSGVGSISKSDLLMALTGSRLVIGFNVGAVPKLEQWVKEHGVEVRLYNVIYELADDMKNITRSFIEPEIREKITGKAKVIALFKSRPGGIILGCEVLEGSLAVGKHFRIITAMGPVYTGRIASLEIEKKQVKEARMGHQVGLKIMDFKQAKTGDLVECFETVLEGKSETWKPSGRIFHIEAPSNT